MPKSKKSPVTNVSAITTTSSQQKKKKKKVRQHQLHSYSGYLSQCAQDYAKVVANPFRTSHSACVPSFPAIPSRKITVRGSNTLFTDSTTSFGYVVFSPDRAFISDKGALPANLLPAVGYSSVGSTGNSVTSTTGGAGQNLDALNSEYDFSVDKRNVNYRIVGAGLRVKYSGTALNAGGTIIGMELPDHGVLNGFTFGDFASYGQSKQMDIVPGRWYNVRWNPKFPQELTYQTALAGLPNFNGDTTSTLNAGQFACLGFAIAGAAPSQPFTWEAYAQLELVSGMNQGASNDTIVLGTTASHSDILGLSAVQEVAQKDEMIRPYWTERDEETGPFTRGFVETAGLSLANLMKPFLGPAMQALPSVATFVGTGLRSYMNPSTNSEAVLGRAMLRYDL